MKQGLERFKAVLGGLFTTATTPMVAEPQLSKLNEADGPVFSRIDIEQVADDPLLKLDEFITEYGPQYQSFDDLKNKGLFMCHGLQVAGHPQIEPPSPDRISTETLAYILELRGFARGEEAAINNAALALSMAQVNWAVSNNVQLRFDPEDAGLQSRLTEYFRIPQLQP